MVNPGLEDIKGASFNFDFSYERTVDREAAAAEAKSDARSSSGGVASSLQVWAAASRCRYQGMSAVHVQATTRLTAILLCRWRIPGRRRS